MKGLVARLRQTAMLMVGQTPYEAYLRHMETRHPEQQAMTRIQFFRDRERARYGSGGGRCC
jgi:uncharacterized short protein YbdD (DUF466 family)